MCKGSSREAGEGLSYSNNLSVSSVSYTHLDTLPQDGSCDFYHMENEHGWASIRAYSVFPGIWLAFQEAYTYSFENHTGWRDDLLEIAHCQEGRLEYEDADRFFYLGEGDMSIHRLSLIHI